MVLDICIPHAIDSADLCMDKLGNNPADILQTFGAWSEPKEADGRIFFCSKVQPLCKAKLVWQELGGEAWGEGELAKPSPRSIAMAEDDAARRRALALELGVCPSTSDLSSMSMWKA